MYKGLINPELVGKPAVNRITPSHYDQMQGGMAICGKGWCDYLVYDCGTGQMYAERVPFDKVYWDEVLYPSLVRFLEVTMVDVGEQVREMQG